MWKNLLPRWGQTEKSEARDDLGTQGADASPSYAHGEEQKLDDAASANNEDTDIVPPDELGELLSLTNFTQREIRGFYKYGGKQTISKPDFAYLCFQNNIRSAGLVERMWTTFDANDDGQVTHFELVQGLNPLLRGDRKQVASLFFDLYEIDGDGEVSAAEIISVYSDMVGLTSSDERAGLSSAEKERIRVWVEQQRAKASGGKLDRETFVQAIQDMAEEENETNCSKDLLAPRTFYYVFLTAWFEVGTSFALPAMGALSDRIKDRYDITEQGIGTATSAYFFAAMVGPLVGGIFMDKFGPGLVIIGANVIVTLGASLQALSNGPNQFWLLIVGRLLLGFGGEITPFTTVETLGRLFPDWVGLMAGIRNLIQSGSTFLAFVLLPAWANAIGDGNKGTSFALWMCAVLGVVSTLASAITYFSIRKEKNVSAEEQSDQATVARVMRAFAKATAPKATGIQRWQLPLSFYLAIFGIKAQYFAPFGFTAFSNEIYSTKFGQSAGRSSMFSGIISLIAGLLSPPMGQLSDNVGRRSSSLAFASSLAMVGFFILAVSDGGSAPVWVSTILFALQYGFGDTVAYLSIRFTVGVTRAGVGYGVYGIIGNLIATVVPIIGGALLDSGDTDDSSDTAAADKVLWYFAALMACGSLCWIGVLLLEGPRSLLELPSDKVIETTDEDLQLAALCFVIGKEPSKHPVRSTSSSGASSRREIDALLAKQLKEAKRSNDGEVDEKLVPEEATDEKPTSPADDKV